MLIKFAALPTEGLSTFNKCKCKYLMNVVSRDKNHDKLLNSGVIQIDDSC